jgi:DNA-binding PadR family transcriptional regulator
VQKENLWFFILLLLSTEARYGYELRKLVNEQFGFWSGNVTAYRVLYSLKNAGMVKSEMRDRRKYYMITETGEREVEAAKTFLESVVKTAGRK